MSGNKLIVAYIRLSEEDNEKESQFSKSIYNQSSIIKSYAEKMGFKIDKEYIDDGYSGINFDRPAFEEMLNEIDKDNIAMIITKDMSRLGRGFIETAYYITQYFAKKNVRYIAVDDKYDSNDPTNDYQEVLVSIRSILNDRVVKETSIKRTATAEEKTKEGQFIGFIAPYGYEIVKKGDKRTLEIEPNAGKIVKRIFMEIAMGKSREEVANELNEEKINPPITYLKMTPSKGKYYSKEWSAGIIYRILKNKTYTGRIVKRKSTKKNYWQKKRDFIPISERETTDITHPILIPETLFKEANSKLKTNKKNKTCKYNGPFEKLIICGECGKIMNGHIYNKNNKSEFKFECNRYEKKVKCKNRSIQENKLQKIVEDTIKDLISRTINEEDIINEVSKKVMQKKRYNLKIENLKHSINLHNTNIHNLYLQKANGKISLEEFIEKKNKETEQKEKEEQELIDTTNKNNIEIKKQEIIEEYNKFINGDILLKDYLHELIENITIYKDNTIQINFKFGVGKTKTIKLY